jgi:uncharacterized membrane protein affecting hemolysin expression
MSSPVGNRLRQMPLQRKLITIMTIVALTSLILAVVAFAGNQYRVFQETTRAKLTSLAQIIGDNSKAAIQFSDADAAAETLAALAAVGHVLDACIYTADKQVFADYRSGRAMPYRR